MFTRLELGTRQNLFHVCIHGYYIGFYVNQILFFWKAVSMAIL